MQVTHRYGTARSRRDCTLFLDFDGVLNSERFARAHARGGVIGLDPEAVRRLHAIVERTGAQIVVSSVKRLHNSLSDLRGMLVAAGYPHPCPIAGKTPSGVPYPAPASDNRRGYEIQAWLDEHPGIKRFVILDDSADMAHLLPYLVRTTGERGLEDEHVERAVALLNAP